MSLPTVVYVPAGFNTVRVVDLRCGIPLGVLYELFWLCWSLPIAPPINAPIPAPMRVEPVSPPIACPARAPMPAPNDAPSSVLLHPVSESTDTRPSVVITLFLCSFPPLLVDLHLSEGYPQHMYAVGHLGHRG